MPRYIMQKKVPGDENATRIYVPTPFLDKQIKEGNSGFEEVFGDVVDGKFISEEKMPPKQEKPPEPEIPAEKSAPVESDAFPPIPESLAQFTDKEKLEKWAAENVPSFSFDRRKSLQNLKEELSIFLESGN